MKTALTPAQWTFLQEILDGAADLDGPERSAYLDRACAGQPDLRARAESLLAAMDSDSGTFMHSAIREAASLKPGPPTSVEIVPQTRVRRRLPWVAAILAFVLVAAMAVWLGMQTRQARDDVKAEKQVADFLAGLFGPDDPATRELLDRSLPRIEGSNKPPEIRARLLALVGGIYTRLGAPDVANRLLNEAVGLRRNVLHREDAELANSLSLLADNAMILRQWNDAEKLYRESLRVEPNAATQANLASLLAKEGKLMEAESLSRGDSLKSVYLQEGKYAKAEELPAGLAGLGRFDEAEAAARKAGDDLTLAQVLLAAGKSDEASSIARTLPVTSASTEVLAGAAFERGDAGKARKLFDEVLEMRQKDLPPGNLQIAATWLNLAENDAALGDFAAAGVKAGRADNMYQLSLGRSSPLLAESHVVLSEIEAAEGHWSQAQMLAQEALDICRATLPLENPVTARAQAALGWALWKQGQASDAAALLESAYKTDRAKYHEMSATRQSARVASLWSEFQRANTAH